MRATGKTSWVKRAGLLTVALLIILEIPEVFANTGTFIDNSNSNVALAYSTERKINYDGTRWWSGYYNGTQTELAYSSNKITWHPGIAVWNSSITDPTDIKIYNNTIIYACTTYKKAPFTDYVLFRTGNISGTSINWGSIRPALTWVSDASQHWFGCSVSFDGSAYLVSVSNWQGNAVASVARSTNKGVTWGSGITEGFPSAGAISLNMASGKQMVIKRLYDNAFPLDNRAYSYIWSGAAWGVQTYITADNVANINDQIDGGFSAIAKPSNPDIIYFAYLKRNSDVAPITYTLKFTYYQSGWQAATTIIANVSTTSYPTTTFDSVANTVTVGFMNNSLAYSKTYYLSNSSFGSLNLIGNPSTPVNGYLIGTEGRNSNAIDYMIENGGGVPYNVTLLTLSYSTTTTTSTVTTLTTQTTTNDTIVDAVANQFAAVMENLFPALMIILVFVYLAYKAGASGEVLAYVFIITLVLTSFVNLMPWWITVIVSVIMIAILLNYRQRGGGVPQ